MKKQALLLILIAPLLMAPGDGPLGDNTGDTEVRVRGKDDGGTVRQAEVDPQQRLKVNPFGVEGQTEFARIAKGNFLDSEEVRYDIPTLLTSADIYIGVAADGTATSATSWTVIRYYFDAGGNPSRGRFRTGVAWDSRTTGW